VQLSLPLRAPPETTDRRLSVGGRTYQVRIARHRRARRYLLRVCADGALRLTVPRGASIVDGLKFAERQADWIERERIRQRRRAEPWHDGSTILFRGQLERLRVSGLEVACGEERIPLSGSDDDIRASVERHLTAVAARELPARCLQFAGLHGLDVARVVVRNQRSRWGACSPRRVITLNWRLIQMPANVSDYVLLHELMHLRQPNHSRRFWRQVEAVCADWRDAERWLRRHGREIL
jgi:predicted metal-dependent hydrolase